MYARQWIKDRKKEEERIEQPTCLLFGDSSHLRIFINGNIFSTV